MKMHIYILNDSVLADFFGTDGEVSETTERLTYSEWQDSRFCFYDLLAVKHTHACTHTKTHTQNCH